MFSLRMFLCLSLVILAGCKTKQNGTADSPTTAINTPAPIRSSLVPRDKGTPGFNPHEYNMVRWPLDKEAYFPESKYLRDVSMLDFPADKPPHKQKGVKIIRPGECSSWKDCGLDDPNIHYFLITPGDYTDFGKLELSTSGTAKQKRIIRYYNPKLSDPYNPPHPVKFSRKADMEVRIESIRMVGTSHWVFHGLTFRGKGRAKKGLVGGYTSQIGFGSNHNIINYCLFEEFLGVGAMRIFQSDYNTVQNCVVRNPVRGPGVGADMGGIGVSAYHNEKARGNRIVNNEIYNVTDCVGLVRNVAKNGDYSRSQMGEVPGTIIENNDFYIEKSLYRIHDGQEWACAENGLDFKEGTKSTDPKDRVRVLNNRIWGYRPTDQSCGGSGSSGAGVTIHRNASNMILRGNIIYDVPQGISVSAPNKKKYPDEKAENIALVNNLFYDIKDPMPGNFNSGLALKLTIDTDVYYNTVVGARQLVFLKEKKAKTRFQCNTFIDIEEAHAYERNNQSWVSMNAWYNYPDREKIYSHRGKSNTFGNSASAAELDDFTFYVKRWTGPEKVVLKNVIPSKNKKGPNVAGEDGCHCARGGDGGRWWAKE